jgi:uncharacterized protein (TIGR02246 family)
MTATNQNQQSTAKADEAAIRSLIAKWARALEAKDVNGLVADYAPDAVLYDAIPPYKTVGVEGIRKAWESCLPYFPDAFKSEHCDLVVHVSGDTAFVHGLHRFLPEDPNHPWAWMRITVGYRRIGGNWRVVHEHISAPFNPMDSKVWTIRNPDVADMPDYSAAGCNSEGAK